MSTTTAYVTVTVARNERNHGIYEVHKAGCAHLNLRHMDVMVTDDTPNPDEFAQDYAAGSEGILTTLGPCLRRGKRPVYGTI